MGSSLVSIIVPVYNAQKVLGQTVNTILSQTYKNIELILVDDGSKDKSSSMCDDFAAMDSRVRVFHNENHGVSYTRNFAVERASGEYIMFVDSDDPIEPDAVELLLNAAEKYEVDLVFGGYGKFNDGRKNDFETRGVLPPDAAPSAALFQSREEIVALYTQPRTSLAAVAVWAKLYRTGIIRKYNVRFPEDMTYEEDCCFNLQYFRHISSAFSYQKPIYHYRQNIQSLSKSYDIRKFLDLTRGYRERCKLFKELGMDKKIVDLKNIFLLVLINTYQKIEKTDISRDEKIKNYSEIVAIDDVQDVVANATSVPNKRLYKLAVDATRKGSGKMVYLWMHLWYMDVQRRSKRNAKKNARKKARQNNKWIQKFNQICTWIRSLANRFLELPLVNRMYMFVTGKSAKESDKKNVK